MIVGIIILAALAIVAILFLKEAIWALWFTARAMIRGYRGKTDPNAPPRDELPEWAQENPGDPTKGWAGF